MYYFLYGNLNASFFSLPFFLSSIFLKKIITVIGLGLSFFLLKKKKDYWPFPSLCQFLNSTSPLPIPFILSHYSNY